MGNVLPRIGVITSGPINRIRSILISTKDPLLSSSALFSWSHLIKNESTSLLFSLQHSFLKLKHFFAHLSVSLALESFSIFCPQKGQNFEKYFKPRKPKRDNQKIFANPEKCLESIFFLDKSLLKSLSNREINFKSWFNS